MELWKIMDRHNVNYEISNYGRVRRNGKVLKNNNDTNGYLSICLCANGVTSRYRIHRLVGYYFIPCEDYGLTINHIDGDRKNNHYSNLEWCTHSENLKHKYRVLGNIPAKPFRGKFGREHNRSRWFTLKDNNGNIYKYYSGLEFYRKTGLDRTSISYAIKHKKVPYQFKRGGLKGWVLIDFNKSFK